MGAEVSNLMGPSVDQPLVYDVVGARKPGSTPGRWDGAYVGCRCHTTGKIIAAMFKDGQDYISDDGAVTWDQCNSMVNALMAKGWTPMDREDIKKTSGM